MWKCEVRLISLALFASVAFAAGMKRVLLQLGTNLGSTIEGRVQSLLKSAGVEIDLISSETKLSPDHEIFQSLELDSTIILSFGNASYAKEAIDYAQLRAEGYGLTYTPPDGDQTVPVFAADGLPMDSKATVPALNTVDFSYGAITGTYAALEALGFGFLHPLSPFVPSELLLSFDTSKFYEKYENPYWETRTWHVHTQHPLEFTEVLNGFDIPFIKPSTSTMTSSRKDESLADEKSLQERCSELSGGYCETWENMVPQLDMLFEWLVANRQNRVEILLLGSDKWGDLTDGDKRKSRLREVNQHAHAFGLLIGADIPIANRQQHGWRMVDPYAPFEQQSADIKARVDWIFQADFDFISTESGLSEFTKPSCDLMLDLFEVYTERITQEWQRETWVKVHCSTDQVCDEVISDDATNDVATDDDQQSTTQWKYPDPRTGEPINFNFLPTYASDGLVVMPHTVQVYSFDDPTAGAYGNNNFSYMADYLAFESSQKKRSVLFYGETAYWVNVDVDVPLFLPLYAQRRLSDLRRIAQAEKDEEFRMNGQMNFESGWEFGYFVSNVITARASWNPQTEVAPFTEDTSWEAFSLSLSPIVQIFGQFAEEVRIAVIAIAKSQEQLMVYGRVGGEESMDLMKLSGHAYMSGCDTWVDIPHMLGMHSTQPDKVHLKDTSDPLWPYVLPLLQELTNTFEEHYEEFNGILEKATRSHLSSQAIGYLEELTDSVQLLHLRARHQLLLYSAQDVRAQRKIENPPIAQQGSSGAFTAAGRAVADGGIKEDNTVITREKLLLDARGVLQTAHTVMDRRVSSFRVPVDRISGWRTMPVTYMHGYVWAARSLYFWWRDQGIVERKSLLSQSPCYLNRIAFAELGLGWGGAVEEAVRLAMREAGEANESLLESMLADCLAPPLVEFQFPRDL